MSAQRRGPVPAPLGTAPSPRPTTIAINVEEWEAKAPLGDIEIRSVGLIKAANEKVPIPLKFSSSADTPSRPSTPVGKKLASRPATPQTLQKPGIITHGLHPSHPIQTPQQFYDWFALIDRSVAHAQGAHFRAHLSSVSNHTAACDDLVEKIDSIEQEVTEMLDAWRGVEEGGRSLKGACEVLLDERDKLLQVTDAISERLEYFTELEQATRMLNHPGESLVLQSDFLYMVERVDICIDYLRSHRSYRESEVYLLRFQQCMTRSMTLIKMYFVNSLRALAGDVSKRMNEKDVSTTAQTHLLYTRFKSFAPQLAPLLGEMEHRTQTYPAQLSALLSECHSAYFAARKSLIVPRLTNEVRALGIGAGDTGIVELTRAGCSYLKQLCTDEFELYREFFGGGEDALYTYLESLCDYLYDDLRPRILHEQRLKALCEVCTVLQALMVLDGGASDSEDEGSDADAKDRNTELDADPFTKKRGGRRTKRKGGLGRLHISHLLQMVLQDAQTRLFFKAQSVMQAEVRYYVPKEKELDWPGWLISARQSLSISSDKEKEKDNGEGRQAPQSLTDLFSRPERETWYPTVQKTVDVLAQLHEFVKPAIFSDIALESVTLCRQSLSAAAATMKTQSQAKSSGRSSLDADLFLVRHLLVLKELVYGVDIEEAVAKDEFAGGGVTETLASMLNRTTLLPEAVFTSLGVQRDSESTWDAKMAIDQDLRQACSDVIAQVADASTQPLRAFILLSTSASPPDAASKTRSEKLGTDEEDDPAKVYESFAESLPSTVPESVSHLQLYVEDKRTVSVLVGHVKDRIVETYGEFRECALRKGVIIAGESEVRGMVGRVVDPVIFS